MFKSVIGDLSYTEKDVFDRARSSMQVAVEPALMKDRFDMRGVIAGQSASTISREGLGVAVSSGVLKTALAGRSRARARRPA